MMSIRRIRMSRASRKYVRIISKRNHFLIFVVSFEVLKKIEFCRLIIYIIMNLIIKLGFLTIYLDEINLLLCMNLLTLSKAPSRISNSR